MSHELASGFRWRLGCPIAIQFDILSIIHCTNHCGDAFRLHHREPLINCSFLITIFFQKNIKLQFSHHWQLGATLLRVIAWSNYYTSNGPWRSQPNLKPVSPGVGSVGFGVVMVMRASLVNGLSHTHTTNDATTDIELHRCNCKKKRWLDSDAQCPMNKFFLTFSPHSPLENPKRHVGKTGAPERDSYFQFCCVASHSLYCEWAARDLSNGINGWLPFFLSTLFLFWNFIKFDHPLATTNGAAVLWMGFVKKKEVNARENRCCFFLSQTLKCFCYEWISWMAEKSIFGQLDKGQKVSFSLANWKQPHIGEVFELKSKQVQ